MYCVDAGCNDGTVLGCFRDKLLGWLEGLVMDGVLLWQFHNLLGGVGGRHYSVVEVKYAR